MGRLYDLIQEHIDREAYPPSPRQVAKRLGVTQTTLANWKHPRKLPDYDHLVAISRLTRVPYRTVLEAALYDTEYIGKGGGERDRKTGS